MVVVLPTPPFWLMMAMERMGVVSGPSSVVVAKCTGRSPQIKVADYRGWLIASRGQLPTLLATLSGCGGLLRPLGESFRRGQRRSDWQETVAVTLRRTEPLAAQLKSGEDRMTSRGSALGVAEHQRAVPVRIGGTVVADQS